MPNPNRVRLDDLTLVAVSSVAVEATRAAIDRSLQEADFAKVLFFTHERFGNEANPIIRWEPIEPISSRADYSRFMLRELASHVTTSHVLCIQWDGFVLDGSKWDPEFLDYDYIGAVWPHFSDGHTVGNGGFSLRSRKLLDACTQLPLDPSEVEDVAISRTHRSFLESQGIRFAPESVARRFSYERTAPTGEEFGFHGAYNLVRHIGPEDAVATFQALEPHVLSRSERREILSWSIRQRRWRLAATLLSNRA